MTVTATATTDNVLSRAATVFLLTIWTVLLPGGGCVKNVCDTDDDCAPGARCDPDTHRCVYTDAGPPDAGDAEPECTESAQCTAPAAPICDATDLACRACQRDPECAAGHPALPVCDEPAGTCVQCTDSATHCPSPSAPICDATGLACRACQGDPECAAGHPALPVCDEPAGTCVQCTDSATHCPNPAPICEPSTNLCRPCADHPECVARSPSTPACDGASCVQCTNSVLHCSGTAPICEPTTSTCRPCASHAECALAGGVCDWPTGACLPEPAVIYVDEQDPLCSDAGGCTQSAPCCTLQVGVDTTAPGRTTILVLPGTYEPIVLENQEAWIIGQGGGVVISPLILDEHVVTARSANLTDVTTLTLENLTIQNGSNTGVGVFCTGLAAAQPTLALTRSTLTNNAGGGVVATSCTVDLDANTLTNNAGGGVSLSSSDFTLTNNLIAQNGSGASSYGGVYISLPGTTAEIWHNTVVNNLLGNTDPAGIWCVNNVDIHSTISYGNLNADLSPACTASFCWTTADGDPLFVGGGDYHLQAGSLCIDQGDPATTLDHDIDGDPRPQGNGPDIGVDEAQ